MHSWCWNKTILLDNCMCTGSSCCSIVYMCWGKKIILFLCQKLFYYWILKIYCHGFRLTEFNQYRNKTTKPVYNFYIEEKKKKINNYFNFSVKFIKIVYYTLCSMHQRIFYVNGFTARILKNFINWIKLLTTKQSEETKTL